MNFYVYIGVVFGVSLLLGCVAVFQNIKQQSGLPAISLALEMLLIFTATAVALGSLNS